MIEDTFNYIPTVNFFKRNAESNNFLTLPLKMDQKFGGASVSDILTVYDNLSHTTKKPRDKEIEEIFRNALLDEQENMKQENGKP